MCSESPRDAAHSTDASECSPETEMKLPTINATPSSLLRSTLSRLQDSLPSTSVRQPGVLLRTPNDKQTQQNSIWEECLAAGIEGCRRFDRGGPRPNPASPAGLSSGLQRQPPGPVRTRQLRRRGASGRKGARCCLACRSSAPALSGRPQPPALGMPAVGSNWDSTQPVLCGRALYRIHQPSGALYGPPPADGCLVSAIRVPKLTRLNGESPSLIARADKVFREARGTGCSSTPGSRFLSLRSRPHTP